jgi:hypothetical protein
VNILVTGRGTSGSWQVRGVQLGQAIGASVEPNARDVGGFDLAVLVKRPVPDLLQRLRAMAVPVVWDVVDAYPQPDGNYWGRETCMAWLREQVAQIRPVGIVAATRAMAKDCAEFGLPVLVLPHHAWPGQGTCVIRPRVQRVGYQGGEQYLGRWRALLEAECARRGWEFVVNPATVANLDIVVAVRSSDGYAPRAWKSNVKLANAQGCGTPCVVNREAGYLETSCGAERWADDVQEMKAALDGLQSQQTRVEASAALLAAAPRLENIAKDYAAWLKSLKY